MNIFSSSLPKKKKEVSNSNDNLEEHATNTPGRPRSSTNAHIIVSTKSSHAKEVKEKIKFWEEELVKKIETESNVPATTTATTAATAATAATAIASMTYPPNPAVASLSGQRKWRSRYEEHLKAGLASLPHSPLTEHIENPLNQDLVRHARSPSIATEDGSSQPDITFVLPGSASTSPLTSRPTSTPLTPRLTSTSPPTSRPISTPITSQPPGPTPTSKSTSPVTPRSSQMPTARSTSPVTPRSSQKPASASELVSISPLTTRYTSTSQTPASTSTASTTTSTLVSPRSTKISTPASASTTPTVYVYEKSIIQLDPLVEEQKNSSDAVTTKRQISSVESTESLITKGNQENISSRENEIKLNENARSEFNLKSTIVDISHSLSQLHSEKEAMGKVLEGVSEWLMHSQQRDKEIKSKLDSFLSSLALNHSVKSTLPSPSTSSPPTPEASQTDFHELQIELNRLNNRTASIQNQLNDHHRLLSQIYSSLQN